MSLRSMLVPAAVLAGVAFAAPPAELPSRGQLVSIWVRPTGAAERKYVTVDLSAKAKTEATREDIQYGGAKAKYRGVPLRSLLDVIEHRGHSDLALLHFLNGMVVPVPVDDLELLKSLDLFVATDMEVNGKWTNAFPEVKKKGAEERDRRPLVFHGNKLVTANKKHPFVANAAQDDFAPFLYVDSLTGIEFVNDAAWYKQFAVGATDEEKKGFDIFRSHCQFCHGMRQVGARYGVDFVLPEPIAEKKDIQGLFLHVRYRDRDAAETGQMMPFFKDLTKDDVKALHAWLTALTKARPVPYTEPPHH